jgi:hypothetical protein
MRRRKTIKNLIDKKKSKIQSLKLEIIELNKEEALLSDKYQQFTEVEEEILVYGRPKKYETKLMGRIHWKEDFIDEDTGDVITIDRSRLVRINGEWQ